MLENEKGGDQHGDQAECCCEEEAEVVEGEAFPQRRLFGYCAPRSESAQAEPRLGSKTVTYPDRRLALLVCYYRLPLLLLLL